MLDHCNVPTDTISTSSTGLKKFFTFCRIPPDFWIQNLYLTMKTYLCGTNVTTTVHTINKTQTNHSAYAMTRRYLENDKQPTTNILPNFQILFTKLNEYNKQDEMLFVLLGIQKSFILHVCTLVVITEPSSILAYLLRNAEPSHVMSSKTGHYLIKMPRMELCSAYRSKTSSKMMCEYATSAQSTLHGCNHYRQNYS